MTGGCAEVRKPRGPVNTPAGGAVGELWGSCPAQRRNVRPTVELGVISLSPPPKSLLAEGRFFLSGLARSGERGRCLRASNEGPALSSPLTHAAGKVGSADARGRPPPPHPRPLTHLASSSRLAKGACFPVARPRSVSPRLPTRLTGRLFPAARLKNTGIPVPLGRRFSLCLWAKLRGFAPALVLYGWALQPRRATSDSRTPGRVRADSRMPPRHTFEVPPCRSFPSRNSPAVPLGKSSSPSSSFASP
jgi:hypothetical protein